MNWNVMKINNIDMGIYKQNNNFFDNISIKTVILQQIY